MGARKTQVAKLEPGRTKTLHCLQWLNFFLADVQTGLGPFVAAYLASSGWNAGSVGYALTFGGLVTVAMQTPAGAIVDASHRKKALVVASLAMLVCGAILLMFRPTVASVYSAQFFIGSAAPFLLPTVAAITLGIVGGKAFDRQFGKNQAFNSAGNVFTALLVAFVSYRFGYRAIFIVAASLATPAALSILGINGKEIDYARYHKRRERSWTDNALLHHSAHPIDLLIYWCGGVEPKGCVTLPDSRLPQTVAALGRLPSGAPASITVTYASRIHHTRMMIVGEKHTVETDGFSYTHSDLPELAFRGDAQETYEEAIHRQDVDFLRACQGAGSFVGWDETTRILQAIDGFRALAV